MTRPDDAGASLQVRVRESFNNIRGLIKAETAVIKSGPQAYKSASILYFGRSEDDIRKTEFRVQTWRASETEAGFDFTEADQRWACENAEVERLRVFLTTELRGQGKYEVVRSDATEGELLALLRDLTARPDLLDQVAGQDIAKDFATGIHVRQRRAVAQQLRQVALNPHATERDLHRILADNWWVFGGRYVRCLDRRRLTVLDEVDLPLLRVDEVLHLVELKKANIPRLVVPYRNHFIVGADVNEAVNQAANYLRSFDEQRATILTELGVDTRRAFATVVIGHPTHNTSGCSHAQLREAVRTYNSHLTRIEVLTYDDLLTSAENSVRALSPDPPATDLRGFGTPSGPYLDEGGF